MTTEPSVETFIDVLAQIWQFDDGRGGTLRSFGLMDMPDAITPTMSPCVVSYPLGCQPQYATGGPTLLFWNGRSEFHLTEDVKVGNVPYVVSFFRRIIKAAMANMKLSGTVELFLIPEEENALQFSTYKGADGLDSHQGVVVMWEVKQNVSGSYTVSA